MKSLILITILFIAGLASHAVAEELEIYIDKGACPGERCQYCNLYVARKDIVLRKEPSEMAEEAGVVDKGDAMVARTGEVHVVPARFNIYEAFNQFKPGDEVYLLTYEGEGFFKILHNGVMSQGEIGFSPWGGNWDGECDDPDACSGGLDDGYHWTWWLWVTTEKGMEGWVPRSDDLKYADRF